MKPDNYCCQLLFYDRKKKLITKFYTFDGWSLALENNKHLIDTPKEFYIHLESHIQWAQHLKYSFVEVFYKDTFMQRHFIRDGVLAPFMSDVEDRSQCPHIKRALISNKPKLDWKQFTHDAFFNNVKPLTNYLMKNN